MGFLDEFNIDQISKEAEDVLTLKPKEHTVFIQNGTGREKQNKPFWATATQRNTDYTSFRVVTNNNNILYRVQLSEELIKQDVALHLPARVQLQKINNDFIIVDCEAEGIDYPENVFTDEDIDEMEEEMLRLGGEY